MFSIVTRFASLLNFTGIKDKLAILTFPGAVRPSAENSPSDIHFFDGNSNASITNKQIFNFTFIAIFSV
ncbi:MAG TPA: hypothetical protein PLQ06_08155, partial [Bacteroidales bacterium]|nr:hypothetical protein [Bacteroidales bacterium]